MRWYTLHAVVFETDLLLQSSTWDVESEACSGDKEFLSVAGGGRKVTRVEVSLDKGKTWLRSNIIRHEEPTEHGKYWCWVFWEVQVPTLDLLKADEICSRAVDISNNLQPQK